MDFELRRAREKLEKEQKERKERARLKLQRERKAKEEAKRQRDAIEAAQQSRRLEAIDAQLKAEEEMQENLLSGGGIVFYRILEALRFQGNGDKIKLPPSCFNELSGEGAFDKGPLLFKLSVVHQEGSSNTDDSQKESSRSTHSGVLEFTADEGFVGLPPHVWRNLFPIDTSSTSLVEVRYVRLPKGNYAKLQPDGVGFTELPNQKASLETSLRQHATLSQDDVFTVNYGELAYNLRVVELKPSSSVSVLETDIEVDIVSPDRSSEGTEQYTLKPLIFGKSESGVVKEGKYAFYKFIIDDDTQKKIDSGERRVEVRVDPETDGGDTSIYVSRHPLLFPTRHLHEWSSSHEAGSKVLVLCSKEKRVEVGAYSIAVYGFKDTTKFQVLVTIEDNSGRKLGQQATSSSSSMEMDTVQCRNCKHFIPSRSVVLHEAYCIRHSVVCQVAGCGMVLRIEEAKNHVHCDNCGQGLQQGELDKHMKSVHEPCSCPCGVVLEKAVMAQHQASDCPVRLITCRFCGDMVQAGTSATDARDRLRGLSEHESICGSRTAPCDSCGRSVMLKDMDIHQIAVHQKS